MPIYSSEIIRRAQSFYTPHCQAGHLPSFDSANLIQRSFPRPTRCESLEDIHQGICRPRHDLRTSAQAVSRIHSAGKMEYISRCRNHPAHWEFRLVRPQAWAAFRGHQRAFWDRSHWVTLARTILQFNKLNEKALLPAVNPSRVHISSDPVWELGQSIHKVVGLINTLNLKYVERTKSASIKFVKATLYKQK